MRKTPEMLDGTHKRNSEDWRRDQEPLTYYKQFQCPECEVGTLKEKGYAWHCDTCDFIAPEQDGDLDE